MRYSKETGCFYPENINYPNLPPDLIEVLEEDYFLAMSRLPGEAFEIVNGHTVIVPATPTAPAVPGSVTLRQGRLALLDADKLDDVEAIIDAITDPIQKRAAQIEYEADTWERSNIFLRAVWSQLGGTQAELDALFIAAAAK